MTDALYLPAGRESELVATEHAGGPWDPALQHGGPPAALLSRAIEQAPAAWPFTVVRVAVEILGPVPVGEVSVAAHVARPGRSVELVEAELSAGGRVAVRARGWRIRAAEIEVPAAARPTSAAPPLPDAADEHPTVLGGGLIHALEMRWVKGTWDELGPATAWARLRIPLVAGEEPTSLQRLMVLADCGNGISSVLPIDHWMFINPDLTVHLTRAPAGEWLCLDAVTTVDPAGFGLARSTLFDAHGEVGRGAQSLFVTPRA